VFFNSSAVYFSMLMKLCTYNINGLRAAIKKGLIDWIKETDYDQYHFQEIKSMPEQVDISPIEALGYHTYWHSAEKKGYSGVLTISKKEADKFYTGMGEGYDQYDKEGRVLRTDYGDLTVLNCYFPSGSSGEERHAFKMEFLADFKIYVDALLADRPKCIIVGDYNVVHLDLDIHNPKRSDKPSGFRQEERAWMDQWFEGSFKDAYRAQHPEQADMYSWWSYRAGSRRRNKGWRIDYISVTNSLIDKILESAHINDAMHSDHCPVYAHLRL